MTLIYSTSSEDYLLLLNRVLDRSVLSKKFSIYAWIGISVLAWSSVIFPFIKFQEFGLGFCVRTALSVLITLGWPYFYERYTNGVFSKIINDKSLVRVAGLTSLRLSSDSIEVVTDVFLAKASWDELHRVEMSKSHIFIFFTPVVAVPVATAQVETNELKEMLIKHVKNKASLVFL